MAAYRIVEFKPHHMAELQETGREDWIKRYDTSWDTLAAFNSWTLLKIEGDEPVVIACGGTIEIWQGRHSAWFYCTPEARSCMLRVTRAADQALSCVHGRIEASAEIHFEPGHRWLKLLGFNIENPPGVLKGFGPEGDTHISYVRFN